MALNVQCKWCLHLQNDWCSQWLDSPDPDRMRNCTYYSEATNGDRLRILSNEELAETFAWHMVELVCRVASNFGCDLGPEKQLLFEQNKTDWFDWLQSPADRGNWDG